MKKLLLICMTLSSFCFASERIYVDEIDVDASQNAFHIYTGRNEWIKTSTMHRDNSGLYTNESDLYKSEDLEAGYEKTWKCPYCHTYFPVGKPCDNSNCPSKYR